MAGDLQVGLQRIAGIHENIVAPLAPPAIERLLGKWPAGKILVAGRGVVRIVGVGVARLLAGRCLAGERAVAAERVGMTAGVKVEGLEPGTGGWPGFLIAPLIPIEPTSNV